MLSHPSGRAACTAPGEDVPGAVVWLWSGRVPCCWARLGSLLLGSPGLTPVQPEGQLRPLQQEGPSFSEVQGLSPAHISLPVRELVNSFVLGNTCPPAGLLFPGSPSQWPTQCAHTQVCLPGEVTTQQSVPVRINGGTRGSSQRWFYLPLIQALGRREAS